MLLSWGFLKRHFPGLFFIGGYVSFFDSISRAIGTDGSGGGALVELGKPLGFANSSEGLFNNPGVKEAAILAAAYYGGSAFLNSGAATTAAEIGASASSGAALVPLEAVAYTGSSAVASVTAGSAATAATGATLWQTAQSVGSGAMSALNTAGKVVGGLNALQLVSGKSSGSGAAGSGLQYGVSAGSVSAGAGTGAAQAAKAAGSTAAGAGGVSGPAKDSTLTILAAGLTVAAILYQFFGDQK